jgi:hypothetical protein
MACVTVMASSEPNADLPTLLARYARITPGSTIYSR